MYSLTFEYVRLFDEPCSYGQDNYDDFDIDLCRRVVVGLIRHVLTNGGHRRRLPLQLSTLSPG